MLWLCVCGACVFLAGVLMLIFSSCASRAALKNYVFLSAAQIIKCEMHECINSESWMCAIAVMYYLVSMNMKRGYAY